MSRQNAAIIAAIAELSQRLRVAERILACQASDPAHLALLRRTIKRDCPALSFGGRSGKAVRS
jgi:hypothetical protein